HRYLDVLDRVAEAHANAKSAKSAKSGPRTSPEAAQNSQNAQNSHAQGPANKRGSEQNPYSSTIATLEARCPDLVPVNHWQRPSPLAACPSPGGAPRPRRLAGGQGTCSASTSCRPSRTRATADYRATTKPG